MAGDERARSVISYCVTFSVKARRIHNRKRACHTIGPTCSICGQMWVHDSGNEREIAGLSVFSD